LRRDTVENFITLNKSIELLSKSNASKAYPLDIVSFAQDRMQTREALRLLQSSIRIDIGLPVDNVEEDKIRFAESEQFRKETNKAWLNRIKTDLYLKEAVAVMMDYTKIQSAHDLAR
jgi:predicted proteasome-type protease